jgi:hypothetical protein
MKKLMHLILISAMAGSLSSLAFAGGDTPPKKASEPHVKSTTKPTKSTTTKSTQDPNYGKKVEPKETTKPK